MNRRAFGKRVSILSIGAGAAVVAPAAQAMRAPLFAPGTMWPSWLVRACYNEDFLGVPQRFPSYKMASLVLPAPPERLALYRSMLPKQLDMPAVPLLYISALGPGDFEVAVSIRASFKGDRKTDPRSGGWYPLTMGVTADSALQGGLLLGYPKYKAEITGDISLASAHVVVKKQGVEQLGLRWAPESEPVAESSPELDPFYVLRDGLVNIMETKVRRLDTREQRNGVMTVSCSAQEPWAELIKGMTLQGTGSVVSTTGQFDLTRRSR